MLFNKIKRVLKKPKKYLNLFNYPLGSFSLYFSRSFLYKKIDVKYRNNPYKNTLDWNGLLLLLNQKKIDVVIKLIKIEDFLSDVEIVKWVNKKNALLLSEIFNDFGSDKSTNHNYHLIYQPIIDRLLLNKNKIYLTEIGLGTNNIDTLSNMGILGSPGASARSFKKYSNNIEVIGGDVDRRILFQEDRIQTFHVDQLDLNSLRNFLSIQKDMDLIIDDGLHTNHSNINFLATALDIHGNESGSWIIIEDIHIDQRIIWENIASYQSGKFKTWLIKTKISIMFVLLT